MVIDGTDAAAARALGRTTGIVYLLFFLTAAAGVAFAAQAGVGGPPGAARDVSKLLAHQEAFRVGFGLTLVSTACYVAVTGLLYRLLRPVSASTALVAAMLSVMGLAVQTAGSVFQVTPLVLEGSGVPQWQSLALVFLNLDRPFEQTGLVFDGLWLLLLGWLIWRATFLPRALGAALALAGLGWEVYLVPPLAARISLPVQVAGFLAEAALMLWLVVAGVNAERWRDANVASGS